MKHMREIVVRILDVPTKTESAIKASRQAIASRLKQDGIEYDGFLISVDTGRAYVYRELKIEEKQSVA